MQIDILQLLKIKPAWGLSTAGNIKCFYSLFLAVNLFLGAVIPAEVNEVVENCVTEVALVLVVAHRHGMLAFGEFLPLNVVNQRNVRKLRDG